MKLNKDIVTGLVMGEKHGLWEKVENYVIDQSRWDVTIELILLYKPTNKYYKLNYSMYGENCENFYFYKDDIALEEVESKCVKTWVPVKKED